ncbi:hypothetical protein LMH87_000837 [Akanthomyces muscarius]|uniref:Uncharacterized protein n=1 Tax=Akanthomyces muscarius TaxID=2231603 RepID=A0A9W8UP86_AKAMU|nr:hypothetical protein LMH87_000837 [Akanthomyces muscarius]KAJ4155600.1 hypothetical protein LMH87_000837 [Akanthomyces muscarius]
MESLAKFHASSILKKQADQPAPRAGLLEYCRNALFAIGLRLPGEAWLLTINYLCTNVHRLFEKDWPMVVSNVWVTPSNVVVDEDGVFQGCLDWEDTEVFPFGIAVATTHRFLGEFKTTSHKDIAVQKWTPVEGSQQLKWHFLKTLQASLDGESNVMWDERLAIAEMVGVILDRSCGYGKILEENDYPIVFDDDYRMSFLDQHIWGSGDSIADWMGRRFINAEGKLVDESLDLTDLDMVWDY